MKPFVILALNRCGTRMLVKALNEHPDINEIEHEFRGTEDEFWEYPHIHSNWLRPWMLNPEIVKVHVYRDPIAGARSWLLKGYVFPPGAQYMPPHEVENLAKERQGMDEEMRAVSEFSASYDEMTHGEEIVELPASFTTAFCHAVGIHPVTLPVHQVKDLPVILKNEDEIACLSV